MIDTVIDEEFWKIVAQLWYNNEIKINESHVDRVVVPQVDGNFIVDVLQEIDDDDDDDDVAFILNGR